MNKISKGKRRKPKQNHPWKEFGNIVPSRKSRGEWDVMFIEAERYEMRLKMRDVGTAFPTQRHKKRRPK